MVGGRGGLSLGLGASSAYAADFDDSLANLIYTNPVTKEGQRVEYNKVYQITDKTRPEKYGLTIELNPNNIWGVAFAETAADSQPIYFERVSGNSKYLTSLEEFRIRMGGSNTQNKYFGSRYGYIYTAGLDKSTNYISYAKSDGSFSFGTRSSNGLDLPYYNATVASDGNEACAKMMNYGSLGQHCQQIS